MSIRELSECDSCRNLYEAAQTAEVSLSEQLRLLKHRELELIFSLKAAHERIIYLESLSESSIENT
jgi:hypothetical protein